MDLVPIFCGKKREKGSQQPSEVKFTTNMDKDFLTRRSTVLFYRLPNKTIYLKLN